MRGGEVVSAADPQDGAPHVEPADCTCPDYPPKDLGACITPSQARTLCAALQAKGREPAWFLGKLVGRGIGDGSDPLSIPAHLCDSLIAIVRDFPDLPACPDYPPADS